MDLDALNTWLGQLEDWLWSGFGIGIVGLVAIYFTFRTKAVPDDPGDVPLHHREDPERRGGGR